MHGRDEFQKSALRETVKLTSKGLACVAVSWKEVENGRVLERFESTIGRPVAALDVVRVQQKLLPKDAEELALDETQAFRPVQGGRICAIRAVPKLERDVRLLAAADDVGLRTCGRESTCGDVEAKELVEEDGGDVCEE